MSDTSLRNDIEQGVAFHQAGQLENALACYRRALNATPEDAEANSLCGLALTHLGRLSEAEPLLIKAVSLEPDQVGFRLNLANFLEATQRPYDAVRQLRDALAVKPAAPQVWEKLATILIQQGNWPELELACTSWTQIFPGSVSAWRNLSRALFEQGRYLRSLDALRRVLDKGGKNALNLTVFATVAMHALEFSAAATALEESLALDANNPETLATRGLLLTYLGRLEEAEQYCRRCLALDPDFVPAYTTLSRLVGGRFTEAEMEALTRLSRDERQPVERRIPAAFALGHGFDARGDSEAAFQNYECAHDLSRQRNVREGRTYNAAGVEARVELLMAGFKSRTGLPESAGDHPTPIFIVGMPRSGTTLIESVLSAHSRVHSCGERVQMPSILEAFLEGMRRNDAAPGPALVDQWRRAYLADLKLPAGTDHITDKNPLNFEAAGLIRLLFPTATIIHVRRNPVETAMSIYRNEFSKFWTFADSLANIGHFYGQYARLVSHWEKVMAGWFITIQYENFAGDFAAAAPRLVSNCGLEWEEQCLQFQESERPIATFSAVEARRPVAVRTGYAERYEDYLEPLLEALCAANVDRETGAFI